MWKPLLKKNESQEFMLSFCFEQSQVRLGSQATAATGADSRAMSFCGACLGAASLLIGIGSIGRTENAVFLLLGACVEVIAGSIAAYSAKPRDFYFPGMSPSDLRSDIQNRTHSSTLLAELIEYSEKHIAKNTEIIEQNAKIFRFSVIISILGIILTTSPYVSNLICKSINWIAASEAFFQ